MTSFPGFPMKDIIFFQVDSFFSSNIQLLGVCPGFELDHSEVVCAQEQLLAPSDGFGRSSRSRHERSAADIMRYRAFVLEMSHF